MIEAQASGLPCTISDRVPEQCDVTGNVQIIGLNATPAEWLNGFWTSMPNTPEPIARKARTR
ncbi:MAG: hypothetical protein ACLR2M_01065 [Varibaculum sp.]